MDKDSGNAWVYLCGARYYSPDEARFVNRDPISYAGGVNLYSYVGNNPMKGVDPSGLIGSIIGLQPRNSISGYFEDRAPDFGGIGRNLRGYFEDRLPDREVLGYILERLNTFKDGAVQGFVCGLGDEGGSLYGLQSQSKPATDPNTGAEVGRFVGDSKGNIMIEPKGGLTRSQGNGSRTHTEYPNGSNYQRLDMNGHPNNPEPHGHGHLEGSGRNMKGQGQSMDVHGNPVPWDSPDAHWKIKK